MGISGLIHEQDAPFPVVAQALQSLPCRLTQIGVLQFAVALLGHGVDGIPQRSILLLKRLGIRQHRQTLIVERKQFVDPRDPGFAPAAQSSVTVPGLE